MTLYIFKTEDGFNISNGDERLATRLSAEADATNLAVSHCQDNQILPYRIEYFRPTGA